MDDDFLRRRLERAAAAIDERPGADVARVIATGRRRRRVRAAAASVGVTVLVASGLVALPLAREFLATERDVDTARRARPINEGPLRPGTYSTTTFDPQLTLRVGEGWVAGPETPSALRLAAGVGTLVFARPTSVFVPTATTSADVAPVPADLFAWLETHPDLLQLSHGSTRLAGLEASRADVSVEDDPSTTAGVCARCAALFPEAGARTGAVTIPENHRARFFVLALQDSPLVVVLSAPPGEWRGFVGEASGLLDSLRVSND